MPTLEDVQATENELQSRFAKHLVVNADLDRSLVSFQANRKAVEHRWCKYREGYSAELMEYVFRRVGLAEGRILDPFAGAGTTLFTAADNGLDSFGIELLPSSAEIIKVRKALLKEDPGKIARALRQFIERRAWVKSGKVIEIAHLAITKGAYPAETERQLGRYLWETSRHESPVVASVLRFGAICILEAISFTRKDGKYLRWDYRSGRNPGKSDFDKGPILAFTEAIVGKLNEIANDLDPQNRLFDVRQRASGEIELLEGSCLNIVPTLEAEMFDGLVTSPPYCNRYDYTRTYALELNMLGIDEDSIKELRQTMLSCTVENRAKTGLNEKFDPDRFGTAVKVFNEQENLQAILKYLDGRRERKEINNSGIPRMVRNYFFESAILIADCARLLKPGAPFVMVNDNVRYEGAHVPVDLILSDFAQNLGFEVEQIWVLPKGKGNSSQQMGKHGRQEIRKCVYVWRRSKVGAVRKPSRRAAAAL
jgi:DNA modification methylase